MSGEQPPPSTSNSTLPPLPPPTVTYEDLIHGEFKFNSNGNQDDDDGYEDDLRGWGNGGSGKKRKVPNMNMKRPATPDDLWNGNGGGGGHSHTAVDDVDDVQHKYVDTTRSNTAPFIRKKMKLSPARRLIEWKKELFIKRKANFISLYIDAQNALAETEQQAQASKTNPNSKEPSTAPTPKPFSSSGSNGLSQKKSNLPDVSEFEKLLPALEDINLNAWTPDRQGWKNNQPLQPVKFRTAIRFRRKEWLKSRSMEIKRKGWFPEGSFEFELECKASSSLRAKAREQSALLKLANELRGLIITANKTTPVVTTTTTTTTTSNSIHNKDDDKSPSKTRRKIAGHRDINTAPSSNANASATANSTEESQPMSQSQSRDSNETKTTANGGAGGKKKPKKKKRSVLANQSNPHHVDNYRPSRTVSPHGDPYEPYTSHLSLFNPPPMIFLATRTRHKSKPKSQAQIQNNELVVDDRDINFNPDIRPNEDDYLCCFCEYDLYYSTEAVRKKAIRRRKKEIKRKEMIKNKAKNVAEGKKGSLRNDNDSEYDSRDEDEEEDDEDGFAEDSGEEDCHDDGHGRCTCGRRVKKPKPDKDRDRDREDG